MINSGLLKKLALISILYLIMLVFINVNSSENIIWADINNENILIAFKYPLDNFSPLLGKSYFPDQMAIIPCKILLFFELTISTFFLVLYFKENKYDKRRLIKQYLISYFNGSSNQLEAKPIKCI